MPVGYCTAKIFSSRLDPIFMGPKIYTSRETKDFNLEANEQHPQDASLKSRATLNIGRQKWQERKWNLPENNVEAETTKRTTALPR
jgi:hypothetical protein